MPETPGASRVCTATLVGLFSGTKRCDLSVDMLDTLARHGADVFAAQNEGMTVSDIAYWIEISEEDGSVRGDVWDRVLAGNGYNVADFRKDNHPRHARYTSRYSRGILKGFGRGWRISAPTIMTTKGRRRMRRNGRAHGMKVPRMTHWRMMGKGCAKTQTLKIRWMILLSDAEIERGCALKYEGSGQRKGTLSRCEKLHVLLTLLFSGNCPCSQVPPMIIAPSR